MHEIWERAAADPLAQDLIYETAIELSLAEMENDPEKWEDLTVLWEIQGKNENYSLP